MSTQITFYLDKRRSKKGNLFPLKIRVWDAMLKKAKLFPVNIDLAEKDFERAWNTQKPRKEYQGLKVKLLHIISKAEKVAAKIRPFTFEQFEKKLYRKAGEGQSVYYHFEKIIEKCNAEDRVGTADSYRLSQQAIQDYLKHISGNKSKGLLFREITVNWLLGFEKYMINDKENSQTTVGFYLRALRAVFNTAIGENEIEAEYYPFGKNKYKIPSSQNVKKALTQEQLKQLFEAVPKNDEQQKAKDFWFFSYSCNGINIKDIAQLKYKDIENDMITFYRAKTVNTSKSNLKPIQVYLTDFSKQVIEKYGNKVKISDNLIFEVISDDLTQKQNHNRIKNFVRFINQHLKKLCENNDLPENISCYWARHSFATNAVRKGASMEFIQESLGHGDMKTTQNYFAGFEDEAKKEFANKLMEF